MLVEHRKNKPVVADTAVIAPTAVISGDVHIGAGTVVLAGAVVTSQGAPVHIGEFCVIMENSVIRGAGIHPTTLGNYVLVGPNAHVTGATIGPKVFVATGSAVFNGAILEEGTLVAINAVVHIGAECPPGTVVPIGHIAVGTPARVVSPVDAPAVAKELAAIGFTRFVFGFEEKSLADPTAIEELCRRYSRALLSHRDDRVIDS